MAGYLLDSNIVIDALNDRRGRAALVLRLAREGPPLAVSIMSVSEVYAGMHPSEQAKTDELFQLLDVREVSRGIAFRAGRLCYEWARKGKTLTLPDVTIAATALEHGLVLITDNLRDFPMPELQMYRWQ